MAGRESRQLELSWFLTSRWMFGGGPRKASHFRLCVSPPKQSIVLTQRKASLHLLLSLNYLFRTQPPSPPATSSWEEPAACLQPSKDAAGAGEQRGGRKESDGRFLWCLHTAGLLASKGSSARKALSAPAGGSQFVCFPAQVPSGCRIACVVDERERREGAAEVGEESLQLSLGSFWLALLPLPCITAGTSQPVICCPWSVSRERRHH